jgi:hypothetical protein
MKIRYPEEPRASSPTRPPRGDASSSAKGDCADVTAVARDQPSTNCFVASWQKTVTGFSHRDHMLSAYQIQLGGNTNEVHTPQAG